MKKILLGALCIVLLGIAAFLLLRPSAEEKREAELLRAGYTLAEAKRLAKEGISLEDVPANDAPLTLRIPEDLPSPTEELQRVLSANDPCQEVNSTNCKINKDISLRGQVDGVVFENDRQVVLASWQCVQKGSRIFKQGPLFTEIRLKDDSWQTNYLLRKRPLGELDNYEDASNDLAAQLLCSKD